MRKATIIFLLTYYLFGTCCLPMGDFSVIQDLPQMFKHCKATEDKDMTAIDFITDHLINIDCIFDKHDNGDEQKPHTPIQFRHSQSQTTFVAQQFYFSIIKPNSPQIKHPIFFEDFNSTDYRSRIFRPPIV